ncbi:hypothetical protein E3N88_11904 [Mikania micrantha]|uniref:Uncharacterized protein n=1 Tax=Mikania micrantha TaxID=192012 RepID=A0A5N6P701_9ASTR|nr:hypothetical protein E3N88_11904 [Mikania micrantha]
MESSVSLSSDDRGCWSGDSTATGSGDAGNVEAIGSSLCAIICGDDASQYSYNICGFETKADCMPPAMSITQDNGKCVWSILHPFRPPIELASQAQWVGLVRPK